MHLPWCRWFGNRASVCSSSPKSRPRPGPPARQTSPLAQPLATGLVHGRRVAAASCHAKEMSPLANSGPGERHPQTRGDAARRRRDGCPAGSAPRRGTSRPGPGGFTLLMTDGQQIGLQDSVSHWNMGRRLLDRVRPVDSRSALKTTPDPGSDDTVRRWYLAAGAFMSRTRRIEPVHFERALELFRNDPDVLSLPWRPCTRCLRAFERRQPCDR